MSSDGLQPIMIDQRGLFEAALAVQKRWSCECNFVNLFAWSAVYDTVYTEVDGRLVVCNRHVKRLLFPLGDWFAPNELEAVRAALDARTGLPLIWGDVPQEYIDRHAAALRPLYRVSTTPDEDDYLLRTADVAALLGRDHQNTRRLIRRFGELMPGWRIGPILPENQQAVLDMALRMEVEKGESVFADNETVALKCAFDHFGALGLEGLILTAADGSSLGFSAFSFTTPEVGNVHFEKADRQTTGAAQAMRVGVAHHLAGRCTWMNLEQDMGNPGLRRSKRTYRPERLLPRYHLTPLSLIED